MRQRNFKRKHLCSPDYKFPIGEIGFYFTEYDETPKVHLTTFGKSCVFHIVVFKEVTYMHLKYLVPLLHPSPPPPPPLFPRHFGINEGQGICVKIADLLF